jgi:hypothetical protein
MGVMAFTLALPVAAALLAAWVDVRVGTRPQSPLRCLFAVIAGIAAMRGAVGVLGYVEGRPSYIIAVLTVLLPTLVFAFVTVAWTMRALLNPSP